MDVSKQFTDLLQRVVRIESKLVRGFEELGINIEHDNNWMTVDNKTFTVYLSTLGRSITVVLADMQRHGADQPGKSYELVHRGEVVGSVVYRVTI